MPTSHKLSPAEVKQHLVRIGKSRRTHHGLIGILIALVVFGLLGFFAAPPLIRHLAEQQLGRAPRSAGHDRARRVQSPIR